MWTNSNFLFLGLVALLFSSCRQEDISRSIKTKEIQNAKIVIRELKVGVLFPKGADAKTAKVAVDSIVVDTLSETLENLLKTSIVSIHSTGDSLLPTCMDGLGVDSYIMFSVNNSIMKLSFICNQYDTGWLVDMDDKSNYKVIISKDGKNKIERTIHDIRENRK